MKIKFLTPILLITFSAAALCCQNRKQNQPTEETQQPEAMIISDNIHFCEDTYPYQGGILIANSGVGQPNSLNTEDRGYIAYHKGNRAEVLIPADGNLSRPKGTFIRDERLFICDVNKIVIYSLQAPERAPQVVLLPEGNLLVNDLMAEGNTLYASVTNTGKIFSIDISGPDIVKIPAEWVGIAGPSGLTIENGAMYVAPYPTDGKTADNNAIYQITDLSKPVPKGFITTSRQYDGIALSASKKTMYITSQTPVQVCTVDMNTRKITSLDINPEKPLSGPADITVASGAMYIPGLPNNRVIVYPI